MNIEYQRCLGPFNRVLHGQATPSWTNELLGVSTPGRATLPPTGPHSRRSAGLSIGPSRATVTPHFGPAGKPGGGCLLSFAPAMGSLIKKRRKRMRKKKHKKLLKKTRWQRRQQGK